ncbi:MAG: FmdB family transcriptional regulator [Opitutaceae bacterium]|nr:FmdB family transcriptional regulator [Opitutaceae bacterium]
MPIYEYYCPQNHTIYQFFAKTLAQGRQTPRCPDNPAYTLTKIVSTFAITRGGKKEEPSADPAGDTPADDDPKMEAAMEAMEREFSQVDENDPRAMARMMRRMAELTGEKIDGEMEEVVRKLEEGADPESLEDQLGGDEPGDMDDPYGEGPGPGTPPTDPKERRHRWRALTRPPRRDPKLYDYE